MSRRTFSVLAASALAGRPRAARSSGGLDVAATPPSQHVVRVLLASGSFVEPMPIDAWHFAWDGRSYRGTFESVELPGSGRALINTVPLDAYLYGVLSKEVSA
jgi:peptidoglycan hydrolase-like amidase